MMENLPRLLVLFLLVTVTTTAFMVTVSALFPGRIRRVVLIAEGTPGRALGVGSVNFAFFAGMFLTLFPLAERSGVQLLALLALLILALLGSGLGLGLAGVVHLLRQRLAPEMAPLRGTLLSALALTLACLTPFFGWFLLLPYVGLLGLGALILSLYRPSAQPPTEKGAS